MLFKFYAYKKNKHIPEFVIYAKDKIQALEELEDFLVDGNIEDWTLRLAAQHGDVYRC